MAVVKKVENTVIAYAFTVGVVIALVLGLVSQWVPASVQPWLVSLLVLAGVVVGFANISPNETKDYVLYVTALVIVTGLSKGVLGNVLYVGTYFEGVLTSLMAFVLPSVIIVGLKAVINLAKN